MNVERNRQECFERFMSAVRNGRARDFRLCKDLVETVRARFGDDAAQIQRKELYAFIKSDNPLQRSEK